MRRAYCASVSPLTLRSSPWVLLFASTSKPSAAGPCAVRCARAHGHNSALAAIEDPRTAVEVLDHTRLRRVSEVSARERLRALALLRDDDDDEGLRLAAPAGRGLVGARPRPDA